MTENELSRIAYHKEMKLHKTLGPELFEKVYEDCLFRYLKKEVETGASGTQDYVIKKGPNKDKIAKK